MTRVVVVGAGLTGLFASVLAGRRGGQVTLLAEGRGGLALGPGRIEVWAETRPLHGLSASPAAHPYRRLHPSDLRYGILALNEILSGFGVSYQGSLERNQLLPTLLGTLRPAAFAPLSQELARIRPRANLALAGIEGFRDFHAGLALGLRSANVRATVHPDLPSPSPTGKRDWYATDLAIAFDSLEDLPRLAQEWRRRIRSCDALAVPAVLGLDRHAEVFSILQAELGIPIIEIPTLPPCVPGLRLERALRSAALAEGVRLVEGSRAVARVPGKPRTRRVDGVAAITPGGMRFHPAQAVILATGGALHGGWEAPSLGRARESVFGFPLHTGNRVVNWTEEEMSAAQPYAFFGLRVDRWLRPLAADNKPAFENVFAAGGILAGADRAGEGSRQGIDLGTAYRAVEAALA